MHRTLVFQPILIAFLLLLFSGATPQAKAADPAVEMHPFEGACTSAILMDALTGEVLAGKDIDVQRPPASMVKMMTQLLILERIDQGDLALTDLVTVSARASKIGGSQVWLKHREQFPVEDLLMALSIHSANDAAVALAEHVAGSVEAFVDLMNFRARELGLTGTEFHSVHGLPPGRSRPTDLSTARDMANLGRELLLHKTSLSWSAIATAPFRNGEFTLYNPNRLLGKFRGLDGLKTGYTSAAGYCITATAVQKDVRLISVVMGCETDKVRAAETTRLLTFGFNLYAPVPVIAGAGKTLELTVPVQGGKDKQVGVVVARDLTVTIRRDREGAISLRHELPPQVEAPVAAGAKLGEVVAVLDGHELGRVELLAASPVERGTWLHRILR